MSPYRVDENIKDMTYGELADLLMWIAKQWNDVKDEPRNYRHVREWALNRLSEIKKWVPYECNGSYNSKYDLIDYVSYRFLYESQFLYDSLSRPIPTPYLTKQPD